MTRVGAVATKKEIIYESRFAFYIPTAAVASQLNTKASHVFLESLNQYHTLSGTSRAFLIRLVDFKYASTFLDQLASLEALFVVVVPVVESHSYWGVLRQYQSQFAYVLQPKLRLSADWVKRYKSLTYIAILILNDFDEDLAVKATQPDLIVYSEDIDNNLVSRAHSYAKSITEKIANAKFINHFIDPLQPLTQQMPLEVYETFEKDQPKYKAYEEAIDLALHDLLIQRKIKLRVLVVGPGRGPLLATAAKRLQQIELTAVEKNPLCISQLQELNRTSWDSKVTIYEGDIRILAASLGDFDLVISELIGSFGCNEACPEILQALAKPNTVMIPQTIQSFITPAFCSLVEGNITRPYLLNSDECFPVAETQQVFEFSFPNNAKFDQSFQHTFALNSLDVSNTLVGNFKANLYGHISIGSTSSDSTTFVCSSWYPMIFPIQTVETKIELLFRRISLHDRLWYEWTVNGSKMNAQGVEYSIPLS